MNNYLCKKLYPIMECLARQQDDKPPLTANIAFACACYILSYPALKRIFRKRFLKRLMKLLILGLSVGSLLSLLMMLTIAQTRITMCRLINSGFRRMDLKRVMVYVVCFNLIYTYIRSRLLKSTLRRISAAIQSRMSGDQTKEEVVTVKKEGAEPKITRRGTVYG